MSSTVETNVRPDPDELIQKIADYVHDYKITNDQAISTAKYCLMDTIGCGLLALTFPECKSLLGPHIDGTEVPNGVRVLGTNFNSIQLKLLGIMELLFDGLILMILGWLQNGVILQII